MNQGSVANGLSTEQLEQISATTWQARKTLQGVVTAPRDFLQGAVSGQSTEGLAPNELFGSLEAATASVQAQLDRTIQAVGAAIQVPGAAGPSVEVVQLLESRWGVMESECVVVIRRCVCVCVCVCARR
jgi:hypothetical protein